MLRKTIKIIRKGVGWLLRAIAFAILIIPGIAISCMEYIVQHTSPLLEKCTDFIVYWIDKIDGTNAEREKKKVWDSLKK